MSDDDKTPAPEATNQAVVDWNAERVRRGKPAVYARRAAAEPRVPNGPTLLLPADPIVAIPCNHEYVYVDAKEREVTCQECDAILDPIVVLNGFARKEREFYWANAHYVTEGKRLRAEIEALKEERSKIKSGINKDPMQRKINELERLVSHYQSRSIEFEGCYRAAKQKLDAIGKKTRKPRPQLVGVE